MEGTRTKIGLSLPSDTNEDLDALAFALKKSKSEIVDDGVKKTAESLSDKERRAYDAARRARGR